MLRVNITGTFNMMHLAAKRLRDKGRIINFSTSALITSLPGYAAYNASKAAVEAMTRVAAKELGPRRITVNAVAPGPVATELFYQGKPQELVERLTKSIPLGRLGETGDVAPVVSFLAGPDGAWVSGQAPARQRRLGLSRLGPPGARLNPRISRTMPFSGLAWLFLSCNAHYE